MKYTIEQDPDPDYANDVPTLHYSVRDGVTSFNGCPRSVGGLLELIPAETWTRGKRVPFLRKVYNALDSGREAFKPGFSDRYSWWDFLRWVSVDHEYFQGFLEDVIGSAPEGWRDAKRWFDVMETVLCAGGVDATFNNDADYFVFTVATPEFLATTGATADEALHAQARKTHRQYIEGDVWGVTVGEESCWGFYGSDHEASGLMDFVRENLPGCWTAGCEGKRHDHDVDGVTLERCDKCLELSYPHIEGEGNFHEIGYAYQTSALYDRYGRCHIVTTKNKECAFNTYQEALEYVKLLGTLPLRWSMDHPANAKYL